MPSADIHSCPFDRPSCCKRCGLRDKHAKRSSARSPASPAGGQSISPPRDHGAWRADNTWTGAPRRNPRRAQPQRTRTSLSARRSCMHASGGDGNVASPSLVRKAAIWLDSLFFPRFMLARSARADERVRPGLDGVGKFLEVFRYVPHVFQELVDVIGIYFQSLVETRGEVHYRVQRLTQLDHGLPHIGAILSDHRIDVLDVLIGLAAGLPQLPNQRIHLLIYLIALPTTH